MSSRYAHGRRQFWWVTAACVLTACTGPSTQSSAAARYNDALAHVVRPSTGGDGVLRYAMVGTPDSFDPGNTYSPVTANLGRLWARSLVTYRPVPGAAGLTLIPDLATTLGRSSDGGRTWTYTLRAGLRYSDGSRIVAADVKYAVERSSYAPEVLSQGPSYFHTSLVDNRPAYRGPYLDPGGDLHSIETPDARTVVFHLKQPFAEFDNLAAFSQTAPVPRRKDTGAAYVRSIVSSGSYTFRSYNATKGAVLVRNPYWDLRTDPLRRQRAREILIEFNREQTGIDQDLFTGNLNGDLVNAGVATSTQARLLGNERLRAHADDVVIGGATFLAVSTKVAPLADVACRRAVEWAVDKVSVRTSLGGPPRGDIASTVLPPTVPGHTAFNLYPSAGDSGDLVRSRAELRRCGRPDGFSVGLAVFGDRSEQVAAAVSIQASLARVGIRVAVRKYSSATYFTNFAGAPAYADSHQLGLALHSWFADWPSGYAYLDQLYDGRAIRPSGNTNISQVDDARINALLDTAITDPSPARRARAAASVDRAVMSQAMTVPLVYLKVLLYRPPNDTNVYVSKPYAGYDWASVGSS